MLELAMKIESKIKEEDELKHLVFCELDYLGRNSLTIASFNRFYEILEDPDIGSIVSKLWAGNVKNEGIWAASSIVKSCSNAPGTEESLTFLTGIDKTKPY